MTRVLVVEDDAIIGTDIAETLARLGYEVPATADTCDSALRSVEMHRPDVVLMDVRLRGAVDGIETVSRLRQRSDIPVIYLTAHTDESTLTRAKETGPHGYLVKPFNERDLRTAIEVAIRKHELERHLAARERWFSTTLSSLGDAVIATDPEQRITFMNPVAQTITGFSLEAARGRPLSEVLRLVDEAGHPLTSPLERLSQDRFMAAVSTAQLVDKAGEHHLVDDTAAPIVDDRGATLGGVVVFRDVTERKRLEKRLETAERLASLGTMASGIAHELNNPLAAVMGNVTFALEELRALESLVAQGQSIAGKLEQCRSALGDAAAGSERLRKIIEMMRSFVNRRSQKREIVDVSDLVEPALQLTRNAVYHKARLVRAYGTTPFVDVDEDQLVQVLVSLLANAADAIPEGHADEHEIRVATYTDGGGRAVVEIRDTGVGIRQTDTARIFDPFFSTKGVGGGMGLGLAVGHSLVSAAGGELSVESQLGRGSTFRVSLPPAARERPQTPAIAPAGTPRRARILVLDDEPAVSRILERLLSEHEVVVEADGRSVLSRIADGESFDVILCDMMMPTLSGVDVYEAIHSANPAQATKFVFMTGGTFSPRTSTFLERTGNPILSKPFALDKLRAAIATVLQAR